MNDETKVPSEIIEAVKSFPDIQPGTEVTISGMGEEKDGVYVAEGPEFKTTLTPKQIAAADVELRSRSFAARHPELGKMVNCQIHGFRHRQFEFDPVNGCVQKFTYSVKDKEGRKYEQFREEVTPPENEGDAETTKLVPDYRTAMHSDTKPTMKQVLGAAQFAKKRFKPHHSKIKLLFIERTREVYAQIRFAGHNLLETVVPGQPNTAKTKLQVVRIEAARQIRKERRLSGREIRRRQDQSRRINKGLV